MGIAAGFRRKNDIEVGGRKLAGLGMYKSPTGGLLFHASLLVDLDVPLMLEVLRTPYDKLADKGIASVAARITTLRRLRGRNLSLGEAREAVARGYAEALGVELARGAFSPEERSAIQGLEQAKYLSPGWVFQESGVSDATGSARVKTPSGLVEVRVALAGGVFKAVHIRGDFFAAERAIVALEASLRWRPVERGAVREALAAIGREVREEVALSSLEGLEDAVLLAAAAASRPYGCFVAPGAAAGLPP
jgi:lipoate-protein ligase A